MLPNTYNQSQTIGKKNDEDKAEWDLLDMNYAEGIAKVLTFGAKKYGKNNWKLVKEAKDRYFSAAMRHITAYRTGHEKDDESGMSHLLHAATNLMFLYAFENGLEEQK